MRHALLALLLAAIAAATVATAWTRMDAEADDCPCNKYTAEGKNIHLVQYDDGSSNMSVNVSCLFIVAPQRQPLLCQMQMR